MQVACHPAEFLLAQLLSQLFHFRLRLVRPFLNLRPLSLSPHRHRSDMHHITSRQHRQTKLLHRLPLVPHPLRILLLHPLLRQNLAWWISPPTLSLPST